MLKKRIVLLMVVALAAYLKYKSLESLSANETDGDTVSYSLTEESKIDS